MRDSAALGSHGYFGNAARKTLRIVDPPEDGWPGDVPSGSAKWAELARSMQAPAKLGIADAPDPDENLFMPAGYTYLGQFAGHDLTFDTTSSLASASGPGSATNIRTPRFDLDCLYGAGPIDQPYMYDVDRTSMLLGRTAGGNLDLVRTRPRDPSAARAIIGDPRNDENSIICQLQIAFIRFHNLIVSRLTDDGSTAGLFERARNEVRWTYQRILVEDFLPRLVRPEVIKAFAERPFAQKHPFFREPREAIPLEFSAAAYRFGHSMVRDGYRLNWRHEAVHVFGTTPEQRAHDLVGFEPLDDAHVIEDWSLLFPDSDGETRGTPRPGLKRGMNDDSTWSGRLQFAHKIDPSVADPLAHLPDRIDQGEGRSLILRNLMRGRMLNLPSGQMLADTLGVARLDPDRHLRTPRRISADPGTAGAGFEFVPIDDDFKAFTPLWFYVLAEAQAPILDALADKGFRCPETFLLRDPVATGTQLGWVGGTVVLETFHGLLASDPESYLNHPDARQWRPMIRRFRMWDLVNGIVA